MSRRDVVWSTRRGEPVGRLEGGGLMAGFFIGWIRPRYPRGAGNASMLGRNRCLRQPLRFLWLPELAKLIDSSACGGWPCCTGLLEHPGSRHKYRAFPRLPHPAARPWARPRMTTLVMPM